MKLALDPGHPTFDGDLGATAPGLIEAEYTWALAQYLAARIRHSGDPIECLILRKAIDEVVSLEDRGRRSIEWGADLVLSLHVNSAQDQRLRGATAYYWPGNNAGAEIAEAIIRCMPWPLRRTYRHGTFAATDTPGVGDNWLRDARAVLAPHEATTVLVELGFCSNPMDLRALLDPITQSGLTLALQAGVVRWRQIKETR